jgi:hypothetical protein
MRKCSVIISDSVKCSALNSSSCCVSVSRLEEEFDLLSPHVQFQALITAHNYGSYHTLEILIYNGNSIRKNVILPYSKP